MENPREILNKVQLGVMTDGIVRDLNNNELESFEKWLENQPEFMKDWYKDHKEIAHDDYNNMYVLAYGVPVEKKTPDRNDHTLYEELQKSGEVYILDDEQGNTVSITEEEFKQFISDTYSKADMIEFVDEEDLEADDLLDAFVDYILEANDANIEQDLNDYFGYKFKQEKIIAKADEEAKANENEPKADYGVTEEQLEDFVEFLMSEDKANELNEALGDVENVHDALVEKICNTTEYDEALVKFIYENYEEVEEELDVQSIAVAAAAPVIDSITDEYTERTSSGQLKDSSGKKAVQEIKDMLNSALEVEEAQESLPESFEEYKGFQIEHDFYNQNEYTVQYNGDDVMFTSVDEAKQFIDEIIAKKESVEVSENTESLVEEVVEEATEETPVTESTNCEVSYSFGKYMLTEDQIHEYMDNNISESDQEYAVLKVNPEFDVDAQVVADAFYPWLKENWRVFKSDAAAYFKERFEEEYYGNLLKEDVKDLSALTLGEVVDVTRLVEAEETKSSGTFREILEQVKQATENYSLEEGTIELSDEDADSFAVNMVTKFLKNHYEIVEAETVESAYRVKFKDPKLPEEEPIEMPVDAPVEAEPELDIETFKGYDGNFDETAPYWNY